MMDTKVCGIRIEQYLDRRALSRGLDKEFIHGFDSGEPTEAALLTSDLRAVIKDHAALLARNEELEAAELALHRKLAAETLRADQGWARHESANADRNALRMEKVDAHAAARLAVAELEARTVAVPMPGRADLMAIDRAMQHMGDALNMIDGCEDGGEETTAQGFAAIERLLAATPTAQPVLAAVGLTDEECWSDDNEMFNHQSLGDLMDHNEDLVPGCTVWRARSTRPAASELFNMNSLIEDMGEQAFEFAGEYAEDFPDASKEQIAELQSFICDWIDRSTTINFYKVTDVQPYMLTLADFPDDYTPPASHITGASHE